MLTILSRLCFFFFSLVIAGILILLTLSLASGNADLSYSSNSFTDSSSLTSPFSGIVTGFNSAVLSVSTEAQVLANSLTTQASHTTTSINQGTVTTVRFVARAPGNVAHSVASAVDVKAFIQPAGRNPSPVITPSSVTLASYITASPPTASAITQAQQPSSPASSPAVTTVSTPPAQSVQTANSYVWGNCTWWAAARRSQINAPIPNSWGNAATWATRAIRDGYLVDHQPTPGAIMQTPYSAGGLGHVAFVEQVDPDGTWHISEMNVIGLNVVDHKTEPAPAAASYNFIH